MFENIENLKLLSVSSGKSPPSRYGRIRKFSGFIFRTAGETNYTFDHKSFHLKTGHMIFIPKGIRYDFEIVSEEASAYTLISVEENFTNPEPRAFTLENFPDADFIMNHLAPLWNLGTATEKYKALSIFYNLLSYLANTENTDYSAKRRLELISPALDYLKKNLFSPSLSAENLHLICGISDTYFRKIFISNFGTTPQKYIISKRLSAAMSAIDNGNFLNVSELAESVGYRDPLYFSRVFKQKYGACPSEFIR